MIDSTVNNQSAELLFQMYLFGRKIKSNLKQHNKDMMLKMAILKILSDHQSMTVSQISNKIHAGLSATSERLRNLKEKQLITNVQCQDGRENQYKITDNGKKLLSNHIQHTCKKNILDKLSTQELQQLMHIVHKLST
ncbi:MarR family winged helix-turn-helix transcriptional regulator [Patescibacteria group bacterium]